MLPCGVVWFQMWLTWNTIPTVLHSKKSPATCWCAMKSPPGALIVSSFPLFHSLFTLSCICFVFFCPFFSLGSFCSLSAGCVSASGLLWGQRWHNNKAPGRTHTQPRYALNSINCKLKALPHTRRHTIPCWQISHQPPPRQSELLFTRWAYDSIPSRSHHGAALHQPHRSGSTKKRW